MIPKARTRRKKLSYRNAIIANDSFWSLECSQGQESWNRSEEETNFRTKTRIRNIWTALLTVLLLKNIESCYGFAIVTIESSSSPAGTQKRRTNMNALTAKRSKFLRPKVDAIVRLSRSDDEDGEITYFSPNVKLDQERYSEKNDDKDDASVITTTNEYSFFDEALIYVRAGSGGQGASTFKKGVGGQNAQPDGGDGGRGGNVVLVRDDDLNTLAGLTNARRPNTFGGSGKAFSGENSAIMSFRAENGADGARSFRSGKSAPDVEIRVPPGTVVQEERPGYGIDPVTGEEVMLDLEYVDMGTVDHKSDSEKFFVARGGAGGEGSHVTGRGAGRGVRRTRASPEGGERRRLKLTLKLVADVALVGVPNAGKSTFLAAVTRAKPKIANYPFTTVIPNLGVWVPPLSTNVDTDDAGSGSAGLVLCDVPGLVSGASRGIGLGHAFLRHVERCRVILHLVDATSDDPVADFNMLNREIMSYGNGELGKMPQIVVVNKIDVWEVDQNQNDAVTEDWEKGLRTRTSRDELDAALRETMTHSRLMYMSAKGKDGVDDLMERMVAFVQKVKRAG